MEISRTRGACALVICAAIGGCAKVPIQELELYRGAFGQMSMLGAALYEDAAAVVSDVQAAQMAAAADGQAAPPDFISPPASFDPAGITNMAARLRDLPAPIALRISALQTVAAYNDALLSHVTGDPLAKTLAPLKAAAGQIQGFANLAGRIPGAETLNIAAVVDDLKGLAVKVNPFTAVASDALLELARIGLQARAGSEVRDALLAAHGPVQEILQVLEQDTAELYGFQKVRCGLTRFEAARAIGSQTLVSIAGLSAAFARPARGDMHTRIHTLEQRMTAGAIAMFHPDTAFDPCGSGDAKTRSAKSVGASLGKYPYEFPFALRGGKPVTEGAAGALEVFVREYEGHTARAAAASEALRHYHAHVLPDYVVLLRDAAKGLETLRVSATQQPQLAGRAGEFVEIGARIRSNIDRIRLARRSEAIFTVP